jgi:AcrR family transcriptional regulator
MITETKNRILTTAREQFYHFGIKRITMDDIARTTGMSKKTIYQEYADKNAMLMDLATIDLANHTKKIQTIEKSAANAVDEIVQTMKFMSETFSHINPVMFYDLQRYYGDVWKHYENFKLKCVGETVHKNLQRGIREELYRGDINIKILTQLRIMEMDLALNPDFYQQHKFDYIKVQLELIRHYLYGIATLKGHKLISKMLNIKDDA